MKLSRLLALILHAFAAPIFAQEPQPQPIINGDLGQVDLSQWEAGPYLVRMRALDAGGRDLGFCMIQITLDN